MATDDLLWMGDWAVGIRVWVERDGAAVLGGGRLELLEEIDRCHSISAAARRIGMSYRHAWVMVQEVNRAAGELMIEAATGGRNGGGARLTAHGRQAVAAFRDLQERLRLSASLIRPRLPPDSAAACVRVAAAVSLEEVLEQLLADYALRRPSVRIRAVFGASDELADQILEGAPADLFLSADARQLERLADRGMIDLRTIKPLTENALVVVGSRGAARKCWPADLAGPAAPRLALATPSSPLGHYTLVYLKALGLYDALLPRAVVVENAGAVTAAVRAGQADVGLAYASSAGEASGCSVLFRVPRATVAVRYAGALLPRGQRPDEAQRLLDFLASEQALARFRRCGFLPVHPGRRKRAK